MVIRGSGVVCVAGGGGVLTCFPSGIKTQEFQPKFRLSLPSAILKELAVTRAFLHKSRDNLSLFRSINGEIASAGSKVTRAC